VPYARREWDRTPSGRAEVPLADPLRGQAYSA